jgi:hypothetical protein
VNVCYWHKQTLPSALHMSAFEPKADIANVSMSFGLWAKAQLLIARAGAGAAQRPAKSCAQKRLAQRGTLEDEGAREDQKNKCRRAEQH